MARPITPEPDVRLAKMLEQAIGHHQQGQLREAAKLYRSVLRTRPGHHEASHLLGILRFQQGRPAEALDLIATALQIRPVYPEALYNRGNIFAALDRYAEALADYDAALRWQPDNPEAHHNRGNALFKLGQFEAALDAYDRALSLQPDYVEALNSRGTVLKALKRYDDALASYDAAIALAPDRADAHYNRGNLLKEAKRFSESLESYDRALALTTDHPDRFGILDSALATCDWARSDALAAALRTDVLAGRASVTPFTLVGYCDDPGLHRKCAENFLADRMRVRPRPLWDAERYQHQRIRLAYLSADFREHATAYLMAELFELHDRRRFEVIGVSFGANDDSAIRNRLVRAFDVFHDVRGDTDQAIASLLRSNEIDIAVDLKGFTQDSRPEIFAHRPAPIQVGYLGFPGTIGADILDYVIADPVVLPFDQQPHYAERIVQLSDCYQVNDRKRTIAADAPTRAAAGLPDNAFVFCCFNNNYKIRQPMFEIWMRLMAAVPDSVLWLLRDNAGAEANLLAAATSRGIEPARLIFAPRCTLDDHLARHRLADLFLDTLPYNAHTTASDALWTGLPVLTCQGEAFAGRVAASLLQAAGLPELITHSLADYEALALRLTRDAAMLGQFRERLARERLTCALFDADRFRRHLESAYQTMWETWQRGEPARSFRVADPG